MKKSMNNMTKEDSKKLEIRINVTVPAGLLEALARVRGEFSEIKHVFHCIHVDADHWVGVAGDGNNGSYEYFVFKDGKLTITDRGFGDTTVALRMVLGQEVGL